MRVGCNFDEALQINMFLGGLKAESKLMLDASTGRKTSLKPPREAIEITENMDVNANEEGHSKMSIQQEFVTT